MSRRFLGPSLGVLKVPVRVTEASCSVLELLWGVRGWGMELGGVCVCVCVGVLVSGRLCLLFITCLFVFALWWRCVCQ